MAQDTDQKVLDLTIQQKAEQAQGMVFGNIWFRIADEEIRPWWSPGRDADLRQFVKKEGNDILQGAQSSILKKFKAMGWQLEGPEDLVDYYFEVLSKSELGRGWGIFLSKVLEDYLSQDKGACIELIGEGPIDGPLEGPVLGMAHLDSEFVQLTGDPTYPVIFHNMKKMKDGSTEKVSHKIHASRIIHIVDNPSPREGMNNIGFCAVSRVISSSSVLLQIVKYKKEKLSDLPPAGLLLLNNLMPKQWEDVKDDYARERRREGNQVWANIMTIFGLDPGQPITADFVSFSTLPEAFNEKEAVDIYVNIVSLAYGVDAREFWPLSVGPLGTAAEALVQHQKAKGKGIGELISVLERAINWHVLPKAVSFRFDFADDEEDMLRAEINKLKIDSIMNMWKPPTGQVGELPVSAEMIRKMLAAEVPYFQSEFLDMPLEVLQPVPQNEMEELQRMFGPMVRKSWDGMKWYRN